MPISPYMSTLGAKTYQPPVSQYNAKNPMPTIDGVPIGAYGAQWSGTTTFDPSTNPRAQQWMQWMQSFDPSAHWQRQDNDSGTVWQFQQDHPGAEGTYPDIQRALGRYGGQTLEPVYENADWQATGAKPHGYLGQIHNPNMRLRTPFGAITPTLNTSGAAEDGLGKWAPMIIGGLATLMSGGAASPWLVSMMTRGPGMMSQLGNMFGGGK